MNTGRTSAKAVEFNSSIIWITGGFEYVTDPTKPDESAFNKKIKFLDSTEMYDGSKFVSGPSLPNAVADHCMVNIPLIGIMLVRFRVNIR